MCTLHILPSCEVHYELPDACKDASAYCRHIQAITHNNLQCRAKLSATQSSTWLLTKTQPANATICHSFRQNLAVIHFTGICGRLCSASSWHQQWYSWLRNLDFFRYEKDKIGWVWSRPIWGTWYTVVLGMAYRCPIWGPWKGQAWSDLHVPQERTTRLFKPALNDSAEKCCKAYASLGLAIPEVQGVNCTSCGLV